MAVEKKISGIILPGSEDIYRFIPETAKNLQVAEDLTNQAADAETVKNALNKKVDKEKISIDIDNQTNIDDEHIPSTKAVQTAIKENLVDVVYFDDSQFNPSAKILNNSFINADSFGGILFKDFFDQNTNKSMRAASVQSLDEVKLQIQEIKKQIQTLNEQIDLLILKKN